MSKACRLVVDSLGAFLDHELPGSERLVVAAHLSGCQECAAECDALRGLGDALRLESGFTRAPDDVLGGLAGSVLSRIRAEQAVSWSALWSRAFEDWHWPAVGLGSVAGGAASVVLAITMVSSAIVQLTRMNPDVGTLYLMALPDDRRGRPVMMEFEQKLGERRTDARRAVPASFGWEAEWALVSQLDETLSRSGRPGSLQGLPKAERDDILALLSEISNLRYQSVERLGGTKSVVGVHLAIDTFVRASGP